MPDAFVDELRELMAKHDITLCEDFHTPNQSSDFSFDRYSDDGVVSIAIDTDLVKALSRESAH